MITFTAQQIRVIGVMLEKETTTPEHYPLSLNALTSACNQKSNRDPVMALSETEVQNTIDELIELKQLIIDCNGSGRVNKYKHRFCNTPFGSLQLTDQQRAILCVLFLRGPQTPGELRTRTNRLADFSNVDEVEITLEGLQNLDRVSLVKKLARLPGKRESRYCHLFIDVVGSENPSIAVSAESEVTCAIEEQSDLVIRIQALEHQVEVLTVQLARLSSLVE